MKIEQITISGLRSHRGDPPTVVDLAGRSLVAIVGPTGAGKSSVLEAICFALYGEATFGGKAYRELSTDGRSEISVQMTFTIGGDRYQLVRSVAPNRNGVFGAKATWLRRVDGQGKALTHTDQVRKVDTAIRNLLGGMDRVQFCQAVLLAQNRFAELLEADDRRRNELLDILLGLTALADSRKALNIIDKAVQRNEQRLLDRRQALPSDPAAAAADAAARAAVMATLAEQAGATASSLASLINKAADISEHIRSFREAAALRVAGTDGYEQLVGLVSTMEALWREEHRIAADIRAAAEAQDEAAAALNDARRVLESAEKEHGPAGTHDVVTQQLAELGRLITNRSAQAVKLDDAERSLTTMAETLEEARAVETSVRATLESKEEVSRLATAALQTASDTLSARERDVSTGRQLATQLATLVTELSKALEKVSEADAPVASAAEALITADTAWQRSGESLKRAEQDAAAATAGHGHKPGDPCPVCDRELPPGWKPPVSPDLEEARRVEKGTRELLDRAAATQRKAAERRAAAAGAFATAMSNVTAKLAELAEAAVTRELPRPPQLATSHMADDVPLDTARALADGASSLAESMTVWTGRLEDVLAPLRRTASGAASAAEDAQTTFAAARAAAENASRAVVELKTKHAAAAEANKDAASLLETTSRQIAALHDEIPNRWASLVNAEAPDPVQVARQFCLADRQAVDDAATARDAAVQALRDSEQRIMSLKAEQSSKVNEPLGAACATLVTVAGAVKSLTGMLKMPDPLLPADSATPADALQAAGTIQALADEARHAAQERASALEQDGKALVGPARIAVEKLLDLKVRADPEDTMVTAAPDPEDPLSTASAEAVQRLVGAANTAAVAATTRADQAKAQVATAKGLDQRLQLLVKWRANLASALEILKKDRFPAWARERRIAELVEAASNLLLGMTAGRYRFDSRLRICDEVAGAVRPAMTLSGGEKFEAALALALGVAEIAGRSGIRFDTLFLDEGFAGLDQPNLDRALDALEGEIEQGRRIVLITHIGAVADRIKNVLYIAPDSVGGSKARWLNEEERFELGADLDLAHPSANL